MNNTVKNEGADSLINNINHFTEEATERLVRVYDPDDDDVKFVGEDGVELGTSKRSGRYHDAFNSEYTRKDHRFLMTCLGFMAVSSFLTAAALIFLAAR